MRDLTRDRCCDRDSGGSHYHCSRCNEVTGMYGHYRGGKWTADGFQPFAESHFCCPDACESPSAHAGEVGR